jgi:hypothetical protein
MQQGGHDEFYVRLLAALGHQARDFDHMIDVWFLSGAFASLACMFLRGKLRGC